MWTVSACEKEAFAVYSSVLKFRGFLAGQSNVQQQMELKYCEYVISVIVRCKTPAHGPLKVSEISLASVSQPASSNRVSSGKQVLQDIIVEFFISNSLPINQIDKF